MTERSKNNETPIKFFSMVHYISALSQLAKLLR